jgi:hypothetical protein
MLTALKFYKKICKKFGYLEKICYICNRKGYERRLLIVRNQHSNNSIGYMFSMLDSYNGLFYIRHIA